MPRDGSGIYSRPPGTDAVSDTSIESTKYNGNVADVEADLNAPRPIVAGGTGATNATQARANLKAEASTIAVTNYDSHTFEAGSFYSLVGATGAPNAIESYLGIAYGDASSMFIEVRNLTSGALYIRKRVGGVWGAWVNPEQDLDARYVNLTGDTMTGDLTIAKNTPALSLDKPVIGDNVIYGKTSTLRRWGISLGDAVVEAGANTGSNFSVYRYNDAGVFVDSPIAINRSNGLVTIAADPISVNGVANKQYVDSTTVSLTGDTMSGDLGIAKDTPLFVINQTAVATNADFVFARSNAQRWILRQLPDAQGNDFALYAINNAGAAVGGAAVLSISRTDGSSLFSQTVVMNGLLTVRNDVRLIHAGGLEPATNAKLRINPLNTANAGTVVRPTANGAWAHVMENAAGAIVGTISTSATATAYDTSSDERLKEDLQPFTTAGTIIDATNVYDFRWKSTQERAYGIIAQQAMTVYPAAITHSAEHDWYGVDYGKYVPVLLQEAKSARQHAADLQDKVDKLNTRIEAGRAASLDVAIAVRNAMTAIPDTFTAVNFAAMKIQLDALTEAFAAMLEAQAAP